MFKANMNCCKVSTVCKRTIKLLRVLIWLKEKTLRFFSYNPNYCFLVDLGEVFNCKAVFLLLCLYIYLHMSAFLFSFMFIDLL